MWKLLLSVFMLGTTAAIVSADVFYKTYLPAGVSIGMSPEQVRTFRPQAIRNQMPPPSASNSDDALVEMVEIMPQGNTRVAYWYRFKGEKLGAVSRSIMTARMPIEHAQASASRVAEELRVGFFLVGEEQVVRTTGTENTVTTAWRWEDREKKLNIYLVATNQELTVVIFDPTKFAKGDFFLGLERMKDLNAQAELVRSVTEKAGTPIPIVDLLPKVNAASATQAPASAPISSIPAPSAKPTALQTPSTQAVQTPTPIIERKAHLWPWVVGVVALLVLVAFALKRVGI